MLRSNQGKALALGVVVALAGTASVGCGGGSRTAAWEETTAESTQPVTGEQASQKEQLVAQGDAAWANRGDEAQLRAAITAWQQALEIDPSDWQLWARLSRAQYFLADGHLAFADQPDAPAVEATEMYQQSVTSAERSLQALSPAFAERMRAGERVDQAVSVLDAQAVPALYWRSAALGKWARRDGFATLLAYKDEIRAVMTRVLELDRDYFYAAPDRYFGTHVLFALEYAVKAQDRALFERELRFVVDGDPNMLPDVAAENVAEQRKAREALARIDSLFE